MRPDTHAASQLRAGWIQQQLPLEEATTMYAQFNRFEIKMTLDQARSASHPGPCDDDVKALVTAPAIRRQLARISDADMIATPAPGGATND